uniref:Solute carrier family 16 member 12a n=1 Tax=Oryzias latipes TaxID=8090 RepID=A0A3P9MAE1_ORYLA
MKEQKPKGGKRAPEGPNAPEGGWGWMVVAGCFLATICIRAVTRCVSMFFVEFQMNFEKDYSTTAWIHSLIDSTTMLCAPLGSFLGNRLSCRVTVMLGGLLSSAGLVLSSFASSVEFLYISLGVITGLGFALSYTPAIAIVGKYFVERKALAYGIALSGSGIGTFILAPAVQLLIEHYSWRGALLILGGIVSNLCICGALMRPLEDIEVQKFWMDDMTNLENALETEVSDHMKPKQQKKEGFKDTQTLVFATETFQSIGFDKDRLQENRTLLQAILNDPTLTESKLAECILLSNKLKATVLEDKESIKSSESLKLLEQLESITSKTSSANKNNKAKDFGCNEARPTYRMDKILHTEPLIRTKPSSRCQNFCLKTREDFGFILIPSFLILSVSFLFLAYGCSSPVVYLVPYALSVGVDHQHAAFLMSTFGVSGIVGNITFGWITDRKCLKKYRMACYMVAIAMEGLCCMFIPFLHSFSLLVLLSALYGYFDGAYVALIPVVTSDTVGSSYLTSALGVVYFLHGIPYLLSPPIGGWLVDQTGTYMATFFLSGASFMLSSSVLAAAVFFRYVLMMCERTNGKKQCTPPVNLSDFLSFFPKRKN